MNETSGAGVAIGVDAVRSFLASNSAGTIDHPLPSNSIAVCNRLRRIGERIDQASDKYRTQDEPVTELRVLCRKLQQPWRRPLFS